MGTKHKKTLQAIFSDPVRASIVWHDVVAMLENLGANIEPGAGSRVCIELNGVVAVFHKPHPQKETDKGAVKSLRRFLIEAGVDYVGV